MRSADFGVNLHIEGSSKHMLVYDVKLISSKMAFYYLLTNLNCFWIGPNNHHGDCSRSDIIA
jgi:hypothetical protein